jgi:hypothetical protein
MKKCCMTRTDKIPVVEHDKKFLKKVFQPPGW